MPIEVNTDSNNNININVNTTQANASVNLLPSGGGSRSIGTTPLFGPTGNGIANIELTSTSGLVDTYTITYTNGDTTTFDVTNGADGTDGNGIVSIEKTGASGLVDTYTITYTDGNSDTFTVTNGQDGQDGQDGADGQDGVSPTATVTKSGDTATISITDANGTTTATITDGQDGTNGQDGAAATISVGTVQTGAAGSSASVTNSGTSSAAVFDFTIPKGDKGDTGNTGADGYSPTATVTKSGDTATITITDKNGTTTATVTDGSGASSVSELTDVDLTGLSNGDVLVYDSTSQEWKAEAQSGGVTDVEVNGESVVTGGVAEIDLTGYQEKLTAGTDLEIVEGSTGHELPEGYTECEYISNTADVVRDIALSGNNIDTKVTIYAKLDRTLSSSQVLLSFGQGTGNSWFGSPTNYNVWGNGTENANLSWSSSTIYSEITINIDYTSSNYATVNGEIYRPDTMSIKTFTRTGGTNSVGNFTLFGSNGSNHYYARASVYYAKFEQGGLVVSELIPARQESDGKYGLYDIVRDRFFTSSYFTGQEASFNPETVINFTNESGYVKSSELPTIGDGTIIINEGNTEKGRFTVNQTGDTTINLTQVGAGMLTFMQDGLQSGRVSLNRVTDMTITLKGLYDYKSVNADMIGNNLVQANNNRVTGFSANDYIEMREPITLSQYWEYDVDFSINELAYDVGEDHYIFSDKNNTFALKENEDSELFDTFTLYVNGTPVASNIEADSAYYNIKFIKGMDENYNIVGNGDTLQCYVYVGYSSGVSAQKELVGSFTSSTAPTTIQTIFGVNSNHTQPLSDDSYIDFTKCFIDEITRSGNTVTKTRIWDGLVRTIDTKVNTWDLKTDLSNKADKDLSNCTKPHIVETYHNGASWYRVYSDGWCEQGGLVTKSISSGTATVTLLKSFANTDYSIQKTVYNNPATSSSGNAQVQFLAKVAGIDNKATTEFTTYFTTSYGIVTYMWEAKGYIS